MNILFITNKNVNPIIGGIERITHVLAVGFAQLHGHRCFSAFTQRLDNIATPFEKELLLEAGRETQMLADFIRENGIQIVIAQGSDAAVNAIVGQILLQLVSPWTCHREDMPYGRRRHFRQ